MRKKIKTKRQIQVDPVYGSANIAKLINHLMWDGKKSIPRKVVYQALEEIKKKAKTEDPLEVFEEAIKNATPSLEVKSRRVGGATYQVPREVRPARRLTLAMRWIIQASRAKKGQPMAKRLADELIAASKNEGAAIKKKEDVRRMAEANRAFAHFAW
jgi:small subunit ribosomal protein S7